MKECLVLTSNPVINKTKIENMPKIAPVTIYKLNKFRRKLLSISIF
jgi:hypothetical protein